MEGVMKTEKIKNIAILGSTGSIGTQALDIIEDNPHLFKAVVLCARRNWELLAKQALKFRPRKVVLAEEENYPKLKEALENTGIEVLTGEDMISEVVTLTEIDMVLTAMVGYSGLLPTISAIKSSKTIALANKETLVVAGAIITDLAKRNNVEILPVDSEHSAIFQCLQGESHKSMSKIILTASGGPFRKYSIEELETVTVAQALNHPNWDMGAKVTIDSASLMNKGFEMIEARWLFDCEPSDIEILVHPQSIIHSMVQFCDGSVKAQIGVPDMHIPIQYALGYPERIPNNKYILNWNNITQLTFEKPDTKKFPLLNMAFQAIDKGGNMPCILNAANEIANRAFIDGKISFTKMPQVVEYTMMNVDFIDHPDIESLILTNNIARETARQYIQSLY